MQMMQRLILFSLVCAASPVLAQIPTPLPYSDASASQPIATTPAPAAAAPVANNAVPALMNGYVPDATYKLRVGDAISFQILEDKVWDSQNVPKSLVVEDSGETDVPYIGRVMAVGKTCKQLAEEIKESLEADYYKQATVVLSLNVANRILGRAYIWGQVHNQGAIDIQVNENLTAGQAILKAGGFADFANKKKVKVVRGVVGADGTKQTFDLDMEQILDEGKTEKDIILQPGDLIIVPSRLINF
jgi:protein involved in polysaccharide export with SLBB domain